MIQIAFGKVALSKAGKYLILITTPHQTKRTEVSAQWTSNPSFQPVEFQDLSNFQLKICETTSDRKLKIVGNALIKEEMLSNSDPLFEGDVNIEQNMEGEKICVGVCNITIRKKIQYSEYSPKLVQSGVSNGIPGQMSARPKQQEQQDDNEILQQQQQQEPDEQIRVEVHCGFNFYLGSSFHVQVEWGNEKFTTQPIKDKLNPVWCQSGCLSGMSTKRIQLKVCDNKGNILQSIKFQISSLRVMFPYHLKLRFKEDYMGAVPELFFTIIRQSFPLYSITEIPIRFSLRNLGESARPMLYLMVSLNKQVNFPKFIELDKQKCSTLNEINHFINSHFLQESDRVDLVGLNNPLTIKNFSILKSYLNRKLFLHVFYLGDSKSCFLQGIWTSCKIIESKTEFQLFLRKIYYNGQTFTMKKYLQIFNPSYQNLEIDTEKPAKEQWKLLSNNYLLRNKLVNTSIKNIDHLKSSIQSKGKQLTELKKVLAAVHSVHNTLVNKQKLLNPTKNRKIRYNLKQISTAELMSALLSRQSQLQEKKKINAQLSLRMDCLAQVQENQQDLEGQVVENAKELLLQQQKLKKLQFMERGLKKQRQIIGELEKLFEKRQIDRRINQALKQQSQKLRLLKQQKQAGFIKVYQTLRQKGRYGGALAARIKRAQQTLISLNEQYARLVGF